MSLNPNGAPAGFYYQAGATAYLIDPVGTYSLAGASAPTIDPAGAYSFAGPSAPTFAAAGAYIPITGATSVAAEIVDPAASYSLAGASVANDRPCRRGRWPGREHPHARCGGRFIFRSPGRPPLRRRLSTLRAPTVRRPRPRERPTRPAQTVARAPPRSPRRALLFRSPGRHPPRRRLSVLRVQTAAERADDRSSWPAQRRWRQRADVCGPGHVHSGGRSDLLSGGECRSCRRLQSGRRERGDDRSSWPAQRRWRQRADARGPGRAHSSDRSDLRCGKDCLPARHIPPSGRDRADLRPGRHVQRRRRQRADDRSGRHVQQSICVKSPVYTIDKTQRPPTPFCRLAAQRRWRITMAARVAKPPRRRNSLPAMRALPRQCCSREWVLGRGRICSGPTSAISLSLSCRV